MEKLPVTKCFLLLGVLFLACVPVHAAIAETGTCNANTTNCTLSAVAAGDLKIVFAYRTGSTTPPSLATDWTDIASIATSTGGTTGAMRIGCEKAADSSDTGSGTWTNASSVVVISYSGTAVDTTANCNTTGIGGNGCGTPTNCWAKTSDTPSFPGVTFTNTDGTSWAIGPWGHASNFDNCTMGPTGMTEQTTAARAHWLDTNGGVTGWTTQTCTGISNTTWITYPAEVKAAGGGGAASTTKLTLTGAGK